MNSLNSPAITGRERADRNITQNPLIYFEIGKLNFNQGAQVEDKNAFGTWIAKLSMPPPSLATMDCKSAVTRKACVKGAGARGGSPPRITTIV